VTRGGTASGRLLARARATLEELGADPELIERRSLPLFDDAEGVVVAHVSQSGHEHFLAPPAAWRWQEMRARAAGEGIELVMISGFRSFERQLELVRAKLDSGARIDEVLSVLAPPGCSEHHTGLAVDIGTPGCAPLSEAFEATRAFRWLEAKAADFGFRMTYLRDNQWGYLYEPWHWCCSPETSNQQ